MYRGELKEVYALNVLFEMLSSRLGSKGIKFSMECVI